MGVDYAIHNTPFNTHKGFQTFERQLNLRLPFGSGLQSIVRPSRNYYNLSYNEINAHEAIHDFASNGAIVVKTGIYTGRSPEDRFIVAREPSKGLIDWGNINKPITPKVFDAVQNLVADSIQKASKVYIFDGYIGRGLNCESLRVVTTSAVAYHFCKNMFISKMPGDESTYLDFDPQFTLLVSKDCQVGNWKSLGLHSSACVSFDVERRMGLVAGTGYLGEIKKLMFTIMNYHLPLKGILSMHCSATSTKKEDREKSTCLYWGLSGTGKTTLSTDESQLLIGDDEHGWDESGIFNLEGGCYAKVIDLSLDSEPEIFHAIRKQTILENVILDKTTKVPDYNNRSLTENTRASYPLTHIEYREPSGIGKHPSFIIFLTCDAFGVLPPVAKLSAEQAKYHFIAGYTSKVAGTERGIKEPQPTFSPMFGAAFMPHKPSVYARLLEQKIRTHHPTVYLVNTGWTKGPYGEGSRYPIKTSRNIIHAILSGKLDGAEYVEADPIFRLRTPKHVEGIDDEVLIARNSWKNKEAYDEAAAKLAGLFRDSWTRNSFPEDLIPYGPASSK